MSTSPEVIKACCAAAYSGDAVELLLGQSYHPGGAALTRRLAEQLGLSHAGPKRRVADIACGPGATAALLAREYAVTVDGVDLSEDNLARARTAAANAGLGQRVCFHHGDAERIPLPEATFDALFCECALCTFPDKRAAAGEFARILRQGGLVGITDVTVSDAGLPPELTTLPAWVACIADARSLSDYTGILAGAGLRIRHSESHDDALLRMIERIDARITALRIVAPDALADNGVQPDTVRAYTRLAREAVTAGRIGYTLIVAEKA